MFELEIVGRKAEGTANGPKLLFVHGICVGAWVWEPHFLPYFAKAGYDCHALSLRGHGKSQGKEGLAGWRLADYTADLEAAVAKIGGDVVVVGHSLGGAVVQNWLRTGGKPKGAALLAAVPPWGLAASAWRMGFVSPQLFQEIAKMVAFGLGAADADVMRRGLFSFDFPKADFEAFAAQAQEESRIVSAELQGLMPFAPLPGSGIPLFVAGAENDRLVPQDEVWRTAAYYGVKSVIVPNLAHAMMLDTRWEAAAGELLGWVKGLES